MLEIENLLELFEGHIENCANLARQTLQKPDMGNRCGEFDMAETFPPDFRLNNLHAAFFADNTAMLHAFVFAAITLEILYRTKYLCTKQPIPFRFKGPVIDGFRLFNLTMRPIHDFLR